jgi:molecular chaperone DnaK
MTTARYTIGIDLGTGTIQVAHIDPTGRPQIIQHPDGATFLPAVVFFDDDDKPVFGTEADNLCLVRPDRGVRFAKRHMGTADVLITIAGKGLTAFDIAVLTLKHIKEYVERDRNRLVERVVITVPANYLDVQKDAVIGAAKAAGFAEVKLENEPTAALLARLTDDKRIGDGKYGCWDLGCGTFDMSVVDRKGTEFTVLMTRGVSELGGKDFTQALVDHVIAEAAKKGVRITPQDREDYADLWRRCEDGKRRLNSVDDVTIVAIHDGKRAAVTIDKDIARKLWRKFADQLVACATQLMAEAKIGTSDLKELIPSGGGSMCFLVEEVMEQWFSRKISAHGDRVNAVALGAALLGLEYWQGVKTDGGTVITPRGIFLRECTAHAIGVSALSDQGAEVFAIVLEKGVRMPATHEREFVISEDGATSVTVEVMQGQPGPLAQCKLLGKFLLDGLPAVYGRPHKIAVTLHVDDNGMVMATARDVESGKVADLKVAYDKKAA